MSKINHKRPFVCSTICCVFPLDWHFSYQLYFWSLVSRLASLSSQRDPTQNVSPDAMDKQMGKHDTFRPPICTVEINGNLVKIFAILISTIVGLDHCWIDLRIPPSSRAARPASGSPLSAGPWPLTSRRLGPQWCHGTSCLRARCIAVPKGVD